MVSALESQKIRSRIKVMHFDFDPDSADATDVSWQPMRDFGRVLMSFFRTVGTGSLDAMKIVANTAADGTGTDVVIKEKTITDEPDAAGDYIFLECSAQEIAQLGAENGVDLVSVSLQLEFATATDEGVATYVFTEPRFAHDELTADTVA